MGRSIPPKKSKNQMWPMTGMRELYIGMKNATE